MSVQDEVSVEPVPGTVGWIMEALTKANALVEERDIQRGADLKAIEYLNAKWRTLETKVADLGVYLKEYRDGIQVTDIADIFDIDLTRTYTANVVVNFQLQVEASDDDHAQGILDSLSFDIGYGYDGAEVVDWEISDCDLREESS
jgi:hypothetical protein